MSLRNTICSIVAAGILVMGCQNSNQTAVQVSSSRFNMEKDLLLLQYDCKTDVDDLHSVAAFASLIRTDKFKDLKYHVIAGTYGIQEGLYVPADSLFDISFGDRWHDAHRAKISAISYVYGLVERTTNDGNHVWIAEAGQSDFTGAILGLLKENYPDTDYTQSIHVVQHSDWNESVTTPKVLEYVQTHTDYHKIPDGNAEGNGTPGFNCKEESASLSTLDHQESQAIWKLAVQLCDQYNGVDGRYLNATINEGGLDFSDFSEVHYILELDEMINCKDYITWL